MINKIIDWLLDTMSVPFRDRLPDMTPFAEMDDMPPTAPSAYFIPVISLGPGMRKDKGIGGYAN
jgi:hypothetical protein